MIAITWKLLYGCISLNSALLNPEASSTIPFVQMFFFFFLSKYIKRVFLPQTFPARQKSLAQEIRLAARTNCIQLFVCASKFYARYLSGQSSMLILTDWLIVRLRASQARDLLCKMLVIDPEKRYPLCVHPSVRPPCGTNTRISFLMFWIIFECTIIVRSLSFFIYAVIYSTVRATIIFNLKSLLY